MRPLTMKNAKLKIKNLRCATSRQISHFAFLIFNF